MLIHNYKLFKIEKYELIVDIVTKFMDITNDLHALGKAFSNAKKMS